MLCTATHRSMVRLHAVIFFGCPGQVRAAARWVGVGGYTAAGGRRCARPTSAAKREAGAGEEPGGRASARCSSWAVFVTRTAKSGRAWRGGGWAGEEGVRARRPKGTWRSSVSDVSVWPAARRRGRCGAGCGMQGNEAGQASCTGGPVKWGEGRGDSGCAGRLFPGAARHGPSRAMSFLVRRFLYCERCRSDGDEKVRHRLVAVFRASRYQLSVGYLSP